MRGQVLGGVLSRRLTYALIEAPRYGWGSPRITLVARRRRRLAVVFAIVELRVAEPLIDLRRLPRPPVLGGHLHHRGSVLRLLGIHLLHRALPAAGARDERTRAGLVMLPGAPAGARAAGRSRAGSSPPGAPRGVLFAGTVALAFGWRCWRCPSTGAALADPRAGLVSASATAYQRAGQHGRGRDAPAPAGRRGRGPASSARNVGLVLGIAVLGSVVNGRVPVVLTPASGASHAAFALFSRGLRRRAAHRVRRRGRRRRRRCHRRGADDAAGAPGSVRT